MKNIPLDQYKKSWVFRHRELPVSATDLAGIKPMTRQRALDFWRMHISEECSHPDQFTERDWVGKNSTWQQCDSWQGQWDSEREELPELLVEHFDWEANTVVYFCYASDDIIETSWGVFQRCWKNFLFFDDGPLLMARKRREVAQFESNGTVKVGVKP